MEKMLLIDGNSLVFRAYYATIYGRSMTTSNGIPTNAVYGFVLMVLKAIELVQPKYILVAFDTGKKTFRHELYAEYKGTRKEVAEDLIVQFPIIRDVLDAMHIKRFELEGVEADDIIGSMVKRYREYDINVLSSDRDLLQLIDDTTSIWLMKKGISEIEEMTEEALYNQMQIRPIQITDLKGLMGDASDNIPGVAGIGEKTALKLLLEYETVENLYEHLDELKGKLKENLENNRDKAFFSKMLATIKCDVPIPLSIEEVTYHKTNKDFIPFLKQYEMTSILRKVENEKEEEVLDEKISEKIIGESVKQVSKELLIKHTAIYFDYDYDNYKDAILYGFSLSNQKQTEYIKFEDAKQDKSFMHWLNEENEKIAYDFKMIYHLANIHHLDIKGLSFDCMLGAFLCNTSLTNYDSIASYYGLSSKDEMYEIYGSETKRKLPEFDLQFNHAIQRSHDLFVLYTILNKEIEEKGLSNLLYDLEQPLSNVLYDMEKTGVKVDLNILDQIAKDTLETINQLSKEIYSLANRTFNINSTKQLAEVLFDDLGLKANKKRSTAVDVLEKLMDAHPIIPLLMKIRKSQKLYSTYAEGLKKFVESDGKIHTNFRQNVTQTGRLSSINPNLQNISVRDDEAREIRKAFVSETDCVLMASDYSQIELRILAHMANEQALIEAFHSELDIHTKTAMDVFEVSKEEVTSDMRRKAKAVNFGIVYGISDFGLSEQLQISRKEAQEYISRYFASYPQIQSFMDGLIENCQKTGFVTTLFNRRRDIPEIQDKNYMTREFGKRAAMNAPIQGSAADLIKLAMIHIHEKMNELHLRSKMILQVHDELIFNVHESEIEIMSDLIQKEMCHAMQLKVPLVSSYAIGKSWYETK